MTSLPWAAFAMAIFSAASCDATYPALELRLMPTLLTAA